MAERMIYLKEADAKEMVKAVERMMAVWTTGGTNPYRMCGFCHHSDDYRGKLHHSASCNGFPLLDLLKKKLEEIDEEMDVFRIAELMEDGEVEPAIGVAAIRWLANVCNHGMETRSMLRAIRSIKEKLGIPF